MNVTHLPGNERRGEFRSELIAEFEQFLQDESRRFPQQDRLRIDLHCHDLNSDMPDELWGRILGLPETWLKTDKLVSCLKRNGSDVITVTNHNNARSCWDLLDRGEDVLVGAEFTCHFPEVELYCHVLTYGFTPEQETVLNAKRQDIYAFLRYAAANAIPVVLPHPLYFYTPNADLKMQVFEKLAVMFQRFEVLNGQRDLWQTNLTLSWVRSLTPEKLQDYARKHDLNPADFAVDIEKPKILTGGSDDHMGIFAGQCGSWLHVPNFAEKLQTQRPSELALEAILKGNIAPYGQVGENEKLNIALLDYFSEIATRIEDPGLLRILLHRGEVKDKVACFAISNLLLELQKHKNSRKFFRFVHDSLQGKKPSKMLTWQVPRKFRSMIGHLEAIANSRNAAPEDFVATVNSAISELFGELNQVVLNRMRDSTLFAEEIQIKEFSTEALARNMEIPSQLTALFFGGDNRHLKLNGHKLKELVDSLSFPAVVALVLLGATIASTRLLYANRGFLNEFASRLGRNHHEYRALHLTDTLFDKNGVSNSLTRKLRQIQSNDLAIDLLACHETEEPEDHLHVVRPLDTFTLPDSGGQQLRVPDIMEVARLFRDGGYDRIVCSTEGPMVAVALLLKYMFNVPCYFFMHTDWLEYIESTTNVTRHERDRVRRVLRMLYQQFDGVFVLNTEHQDWLAGHEMQLEEDKVLLTAHHAPRPSADVVPVDKSSLFADASNDTPVLFIACRLSEEKGLLDMPGILERARRQLPELRLVLAGEGPLRERLEQELPDARFLGWVDQQQLASLYAGLDLFVFPSRFDTFGNVLLEAFANGMPAIAYDCKGPRDIIQHGSCGYLVETADDMAAGIVEHFLWPDQRDAMRAAALARAGDYHPDKIMTQFVSDLGLPAPSCKLSTRSAA